jgi:hypothetical protein
MNKEQYEQTLKTHATGEYPNYNLYIYIYIYTCVNLGWLQGPISGYKPNFVF